MSDISTPDVQLLWASHCPNVELARQRLRTAFRRLNLTSDWISWNIHAPNCPSELRRYGSPTILVDGRDIVEFNGGDTDGDCCRIYCNADGIFDGAPAVDTIVAALQSARGSS